MATTTSNQGFPYPLKADSPGYIAEFIRDAVLAIEKTVVMKFTDTTERNSKLVGANAPVLGQVCVTTNDMVAYKYNGSAWVKLVPTITTSTNSPSAGTGVNGDIWFKI